MNSWAVVTLFCGLAWRLVSSDSSGKIPEEDINEPNLHCAFENGLLCNWIDVSKSKELRWKPYDDPDFSYSHSTGPLQDHTTGNGYFLSMRTVYKYEPGSALLNSAPIATNKDTCLSFWYYMYGTSVGGLYVYKIGDARQKDKVFSIFGTQGKRWYRALINTGSGAFKIQIEATFEKQRDYASIAIDDVTFSYQGCPATDSTLLKDQPRFDCDFEKDSCSWDFSTPNVLAWRITNVPSDSNDRNALPPRSDGTSYAEVTRVYKGYTYETWMEGPTISVESESCISFWYKIDEPAIRSFKVKISKYGERFYGSKTLFTTSFNSGPVWREALITVPETNNSRVIFSVTERRGKDKTGSVGVDDLRLIRGRPCSEDVESLINCDFERDLCRWYMKTKKDEGDWLRTKDPTPTNSTGPSHDHTTGDGYYIFLDASEVEEANLYSEPFNVNPSGACLSFWYYMHGPDVNELHLLSKSDSYYYSGIDWSLKGPQGDQWIQQKVSLPDGYNTYLVFTAKRGYFPRGDIALDDISITFGAPCESDVDKETTTDTSFFPEISRTETVTESPEEAVTTPMITTTTTTAPPLETPELLVIGKINPAYNNSRVELVCNHSEERNVWIKWYKRKGNSYFSDKDVVQDTWGKSLLFEEIQAKDAGFYSCILERYYHGISNFSEEVEISVVPDPRPKPTLTISYNSDDVDPGHHPMDVLVDVVVKLECGDEISGGEYHWKTTSHAFYNLHLHKDRVLVLNTTQTKHSGTFSCRISKDGFMTGKSNELSIEVREGKRCKYDWHCYGDAYYRNCLKRRCDCSRNSVLHGRECKERPGTPKITTSPPFLEFGIGESFYLVCEADEPAPADLTYTFSSRYLRRQGSPNIMKITNATEADSGPYNCKVTDDVIDSENSAQVYIQIKDFVNLNCDFNEKFCEWFQRNETATSNFAIATSKDLVHNIIEPNDQFIQLGASNKTTPDRAILLSPTIDRMALDSCLAFWYRMHGQDVHSLSVWRYIYSEDSKIFGGTKLWTVIGEKGDLWHQQSVTVGNGSQFYIAFDAIGQVAIDDITFTYRGGC